MVSLITLCAGTSLAKSLFPFVGAEGTTTYRLVFAAGAKGLDDATLQQLKQHVHQASVNGRIQHWQLQVGVRGLDKEVEREA